MTHFDTFIKRNKDFAAQQSATNSLMPSLPETLLHVKALIIGCADMRVNPAHMLGIQDGEAVIIRNIGGRVTPGVLEELGMLGRVAQVAKTIPGGGGEFNLIVLQHTDCGITRLVGDPDMLMHYFEISKEKLQAKAITDPRAAVVADVTILKETATLPDQWLVSGLVYDVATGLVNVVVPPAPIHTQG